MQKIELNAKKIFDLTDRVVVITGGAGLLGSQYAEAFCQVGAKVVLADLDYSKCKEIAVQLGKKYNSIAFAVKLDVTNKKSVNSMIKKIMKQFSKIDIFINNAAIEDKHMTFEKMSLVTWNKILSVNLTGVFLCCQEVGKIMIRQNRGVIININSIYGMVSVDQRIYDKTKLRSSVAYAATKSGLLNLTRYLASHWSGTGIRVNCISFGGVENDQTPNFIKNYSNKTMIGRMAQKEEYIGSLLFLASDASSYMTGSNLVVDGGWTAW